MLCPKCYGDTKVVKVAKEKAANYRKLQCKLCNYTFFTEENVIKNDYVVKNSINEKRYSYGKIQL